MSATKTDTTPCNGVKFQSVTPDVTWPRLLCRECVHFTINDGRCYGGNWETVQTGQQKEGGR